MKLLSTLITTLALIASVFCAPKAMAKTITFLGSNGASARYVDDNGMNDYIIELTDGEYQLFIDIDFLSNGKELKFDNSYILDDCFTDGTVWYEYTRVYTSEEDYDFESLSFTTSGDPDESWSIIGSGDLKCGDHVVINYSGAGVVPQNEKINISCTTGSATQGSGYWNFVLNNAEYEIRIRNKGQNLNSNSNIDPNQSYSYIYEKASRNYYYFDQDITDATFNATGDRNGVWSISGEFVLTKGTKKYDVTFGYASGVQKYLENKYASYYDADHATLLPTGVDAYVCYFNGNDEFVFTKAYSEGSIIPQNVAVILKPSVPSSISPFDFKYTTGGSAPTNNILQGAAEDMDADAMRAANDDETGSKYDYYALSKSQDGSKMGFYLINADGSAFGIGAGKAYMVVDKNQGSSARGFAFDDAISSVDKVNVEKTSDSLFNLQGQRTNEAKGLVVREGKVQFVK